MTAVLSSAPPADLALIRSQRAAQSQVLAEAARKLAVAAAEYAAAARDEIRQDLVTLNGVLRSVSEAKRLAQEAQQAAQLVLAQIQEIVPSAADQVAYDDALTALGATNVQDALVRLFTLIQAGGLVPAGQLDFSNPLNSGLA